MQAAIKLNVYTLKDSPFFRLRTRKKLAGLLRISEKKLDEISHRNEPYVRKWKHKKKDEWLKYQPNSQLLEKFRPIDIPDHDLKLIQSRIADLLGRITPPDWLYSPVKNRSYVDNAARHKGARAFWFLDIADYFPSCTSNNVASFFLKKLECSPDVTAIIVALTTLRNFLPQGSPCSPILAYFSNLPMWLEIEKIISEANLLHSVYADDITVSGDQIPKAAIWDMKKAIYKQGLRVKLSKEQSVIDKPATVTGVIILGDQMKLPNRQQKKLFDYQQQRNETKNLKLKITLDRKIVGCFAQKKQIESVTQNGGLLGLHTKNLN
jgi:hypothetical protein